MRLKYELSDEHLREYFQLRMRNGKQSYPVALKILICADSVLLVFGIIALVLLVSGGADASPLVYFSALLVAGGYGLLSGFVRSSLASKSSAEAFIERASGIGAMEVTLSESHSSLAAKGCDLSLEAQHYIGQSRGQKVMVLHFRHTDIVIPVAALEGCETTLPDVYKTVQDHPWQAS